MKLYTKHYQRFTFITLLFLWIKCVSAGDGAVTLSGHIIENGTNLPIIGATVQVKGTVSGTITNANGDFSITTKEKFPLTLYISYTGYDIYEALVTDPNTKITAQLKVKTINSNDVVVTASRIEEKQMKSAVSIEKMDARCIKETPSPTFFDAIEAVKGVQMTTLSLGMKVPNARGFTNTTNARFLQMIDGADSQAPGLGVSIANTVGPTELDVQSVEIIPGASSALYGMNALNGIANFITKDAFNYQGLSVYQRAGINHINSPYFGVQPFTESAFRYAKAFKDKFAFKVNVGYTRGTDWVADDHTVINPNANASTGLLGDDNPGKDYVNSYGNESNNQKTLTLGGKKYVVARTGYFEREIIDPKYENLKFDLGLYYRPTEKVQLSYTGRAGYADANYQRGNRVRLDNYWIHQHSIEVKGVDFKVRAYATFEFTNTSYNFGPMGPNLDKAFKSDSKWFADYTSRFNTIYAADLNVTLSHQAARAFADSGRLQPGTKAFEDEVTKLTSINNWDSGAQLYLKNFFYQIEGQYNFTRLVKYFDLQAGVDGRDYVIRPDGNSFLNIDTANPYKAFHYWRIGGFIQASKTILNDKLKFLASVRIDKTEYFKPKANPRLAVVYSPTPNHNLRISYQNGYRFPTLFESFSVVNNNGAIRYGGLEELTAGKNIFENSYIKSSVTAFQQAVVADQNKGVSLDSAIINNQGLLKKNPYTYIKPEQINSFEFGYKGAFLQGKLYLDLDFYYNIYNNFIDQIDVVKPNEGTIGAVTDNGVDSTIYSANDKTKYSGYRMWTNALSIYQNLGASAGVNYAIYKGYTFTANYSFGQIIKVDKRDFGLETAYNSPKHIVNLSFSNRNVWKNIGFNIAWRWQSAFEWKSALANGTVPAYNTLDLQISYRIPKINAFIKAGGTNITNQYYSQYTGGPSIGGMYYVAISFEGLLANTKSK